MDSHCWARFPIWVQRLKSVHDWLWVTTSRFQWRTQTLWFRLGNQRNRRRTDPACIHTRTDAHFMFLCIKMQRIPDLVPLISALNGSIVIMRRTLKNRAPDDSRAAKGREKGEERWGKEIVILKRWRVEERCQAYNTRVPNQISRNLGNLHPDRPLCLRDRMSYSPVGAEYLAVELIYGARSHVCRRVITARS